MKKIITIIALTFGLGANAQNIYTIAGNGTSTYSGDGGQATAAGINQIISVGIDASGNLYATDFSNRIRKINAAGIISTIAGNGTGGFIGDGGQATAAEIQGPIGVTVDNAGNVYISDGSNNRIRKVNTAGIISTIAGNGTGGYSGDGGQATAAELSGPHAVAFDASGNMYIVDQNNLRIRMVNTSGVISTIAGNGTFGYSGDGGQATAAELNYPSWACFDASGNLYIGDSNNHRLRKVTTAGIISTVAGNGTGGYTGDGGQATAAELQNPAGLTVNAAGNIFIADAQNNVIRQINTSGVISTVAGNTIFGYSGDGGLATAAELKEPAGVVLDAMGNIYIADFQNGRIRVIAAAPLTVTSTTNIICAGNTTTLTATGATGYTWSPSTGLSATTGSLVIASPTVTTTYTVISALYGVSTYTNTVTITVNNPTTATISPIGCGGVTINATTYTATGIYTQNFTNVAGCDSSLTINATVNPLPVVTVNSATICTGSGVATLTASGANTYTWSPSTGLSANTGSVVLANPITSCPYTVTATDANNCSNTATATVTVNPLPTLSVTVNSATVCAGIMDTITASGTATSYTWSTTSTTASITPSPTITSTYTVMGIDANNCMNWATATINVNPLPTLSITTSAGFSVCPNTLDTLKASGATSYTWSPGNHVVTDYTVHPNNTTTYTLTGVDANGCKNKLTQLITVYPRPTLTVTASSGTVCAGSPTTLSTITGTVAVTSYSWSTGATTPTISVSPVLTSTYSVQGFDAEGCSRTRNYTVTVNPLPTITAVSNADTICIGGSATLTANGANTYSWNTSATGASIPVTLTVTTTYTVEGTDGNGCENMTTVTQSVSTTCYEGIEKVSSNSNNVSVYPNPSNGNFVVTTSENVSTIIVTDILGNELVSINPKGNTTNNINLSAQPSGVYFIKVTGNMQTVKRIIISN